MMNANYSYMRGNFRRGYPLSRHLGQFGGRNSNPSRGIFYNSYSSGFSIGGGNLVVEVVILVDLAEVVILVDLAEVRSCNFQNHYR